MFGTQKYMKKMEGNKIYIKRKSKIIKLNLYIYSTHFIHSLYNIRTNK